MGVLRWLGGLNWGLIFNGVVALAAVGGLLVALNELRLRRRELADLRRKERQRKVRARMTARFERERRLAGFSNPKEKEATYLVLHNASEAPAYLVDVVLTSLEEDLPAPELDVSETEFPIKQIDAGGEYPIFVDGHPNIHSHRVEANILWKDRPTDATEDMIDRQVALPLRWV